MKKLLIIPLLIILILSPSFVIPGANADTLRTTTTTITPNPATTPISAPVTFHARVFDSNSGTKSIPTGTVSWADGGAGGSFGSPSCTLSQFGTSISTSICTISYTPPTNAGPVSITGTYSGDSTHSTSSGTTPSVPPLSAPQNLLATAGTGSVALTWDTPSNDGGSPITGYKIYRSTSSGTETAYVNLGNVNSYTNTGLTPGVTYFYKVAAINALGVSPQSNEASATP